MKWTDFGPFVLPYVPGCPEPVLEHHARLTAIDFCRRTLCDTRTLEPHITASPWPIEIDPGTGLKIVKIKSVFVDGREFKLCPPSLGQELVTGGSQHEICFTSDNITLTINPVQPSTLEVLVTAALAPTLDSTVLTDQIGAEYMQDMVPGIISSIMRLPGQPFTGDLNSISMYTVAYANRASTVAARIARGTTGTKMRSYGTFF